MYLNKLKTSLRKNGFKTPFYVWQNKDNIWCLDGHIRIPILKLMQDEGENIPNKLPANFIDCKNKKEAKKAVLIYNSHYANMQKDILGDWIKDLNFDDLGLEINIDFDNKAIEIQKDEDYYFTFLVTKQQRRIIERRLNQLSGETNTEKLINLCKM